MAFSREHPSPRYQALLAQYQQLHREGERARGIPPEEKYKGISLPRHAGTIKELIDRHAARTILDYGSGKGKQYEQYAVKTSDGRTFPSIPAFWAVDSVTCYDPAVPGFQQLPRGEFDGVICTDVLEHIPEEDVDWIVAEMLAFARCFLFVNIASFAAKAHLPNGENAHCTIRPADWWRDKLACLHAARPQVHLLATVVELQPGGSQAKQHRIELAAVERPRDASDEARNQVEAATLERLASVAGVLGQAESATGLRQLAEQGRRAIALDGGASDQAERSVADPGQINQPPAARPGRPSFSKSLGKPAAAAEPGANRDQAAALTRQGGQQMQRREFAAAADSLRQAAALAPGDVEALCNHGTSLMQAGRRAEAEAAFCACLEIDSRHARAKFNLASCRMEQGDLEAAYAILGDLIDEQAADHPHARDARWVRALILLQMENFGRGWTAYDDRWQSTRAAAKPRLQLPEYNGEPLAGKRLMIYGEQGIGDEIMFASCMGPLFAQAEQVTLICSQRLEALFRRSFSGVHVSGLPVNGKLKPTAGLGQFDYQLAAGSVPRFTRASRPDFSAAAPFLKADENLVQSFRDKLARLPGRLKVGVAWRGGSDEQDRRLRSMPPATWGPILRCRDVDFVDLQYDATSEERRVIEERFGVALHHFPEVNPLGPLDSQAALIAALDLVISVSNAGVHLAGGLGRPTWVMLPAAWGWRWHRQRDRSLFYPSLELLRQRREGDWASLAADVAERLRQQVAQATSAKRAGNEKSTNITGPNYLKMPDAPEKETRSCSKSS